MLRGAAAAAVSAAVSASAPRLVAQTAEAVAAALPLVTTGLEHLGTLVPDVAAAGRFYASVFNPDLHKEREGALRYYVPFGVGYLAIGAAGERPTQIDHYCALVEDYDRAAMAARLEAERFAAGRFGMIPDPDGIQLQLLGVPGGLAPSTEPAGRIADGEPVFRPRRLEHVMLRVTSLERALPFYRLFFGTDASREAGRVWFRIAGTRLGLEVARGGAPPAIAQYGVAVDGFERAAAEARLAALGATLVPSDRPGALRFADPDGIQVEVIGTS